MSFLTSHMEAMLAAATDPEEIALRRKVLDDHLAMQSTAAAPTVGDLLDWARAKHMTGS
jgi:hypothetical protein